MNGLMRRYYEWKINRIDDKINGLRNSIENCFEDLYSSCYPSEEQAFPQICGEIKLLEGQRSILKSKLQLKLTN